MMYLAPPHKLAIPFMERGEIGWLDTPDQCSQGKRTPGIAWAADNGCFGKKQFDEARWFNWLKSHKDIEYCLFATAPDVVGSHAATVERSKPWLRQIRALGYPAAFVAQDGATVDTMPWDTFDALFIGGTDGFKLSENAFQLLHVARRHAMWTHVGRVNSRRRYMMFADRADSCDGTYIIFGPNILLPKLLGWVNEHRNRQPLWPDDDWPVAK